MEYRPNQRPRSKSGFSFKSDKSDKSHGSDKMQRPKVKDLHETREEKHKRHLSGNSKANPNAAMEEAQPIAAALEAPTLGSLRSIQHKDIDGSPIPEPDLSNPTRSRWERPLDTIRKFEAQIDGEYKRRVARTEVESNADFSGYTSRRSSYYGGNGNNRYSNATSNNGYGGNGGYYAGRNPTSPRPAEDPYAPPPVAGPGRNRFGQRVQQEMGVPPRPPMHNGQGLYPSHSYQHSRDTVNTGFSNSSGEAWGNSTDPSSENSSIERMAPAQKQPDLGEQYGFNGFGGNPIAEEYDYDNNYYDQQGGYGGAPAVGNANYNQNQGPPVPAHTNGVNGVSKMGDGPPQQPINASTGVARRPVVNGDGEKRKSWFKRRFSKD